MPSSSVPAAGWWLSLYPAALEAGGSFHYQRERPSGGGQQPAPDPSRARAEAARRARTRVRRYCAANRLNRLGTLTYAGDGCHDPLAFRADVARFFRDLRTLTGGEPFPYLWVPEWHPGGHGLHGHFAVGRFIHRSLIAQAWPHGFIKIKLLSDLPVGSGRVQEARRAAGYLSKYVAKAFDEPGLRGLHRFDVAQGFQPAATRVYGTTAREALEAASDLVGLGAPEYVWRSRDEQEWQGPPAVWASWRG